MPTRAGSAAATAAAAPTVTASGTIVGLFSGGFTLDTGSVHGKLGVYTSASTTFVGAAPFVNESVSASGTGSLSTSITATSVTQAGATPSPTVTASGTIVGLFSGGFTLDTGSVHGKLGVYTSASTTFVGAAPFVNESVSASGTGSLSTSITATSVTQTGATPDPTATPNPVAAGVSSDVKQFQIFDYDMTAAESTAAAPSYGAVWGAGTGNDGATARSWRNANAKILAITYFEQGTDQAPISGHNLAWFQANHPDWIVYDCDANNAPTKTVAYQPGLPNDVPLDISNPAVISYQIHTVANYALSVGANAIGADQTVFFDYDGDQESGWFGCGVYSNGTFVRKWGAAKGGFPNYDPTWISDVVTWVKTAKQILTTDATLAPYNVKLFVNHPESSISNVNEQTLLANVDGTLDEPSFVDYGNYPSVPSLFKTALAYVQYAQARGAEVLEMASYGNHLGGGSSYGLSVSQIEYGIASYLIADEGKSALFMTPYSYGQTYTFPQIAAINSKLGTSCADYVTLDSGDVYERKYSGGLVVVNPGTAGTQTVALTHAYTDVLSRSVGSSSLSVAAADAYVLFTTANGCL